MRRLVTLGFFLIIFSLFLHGCAAKAPEKTIMYWPESPAEPKIAFIASYHGSLEFATYTFWDKLFGAQVSRDLHSPSGIAAYKGNIYVADPGMKAVVVMDPKTKKLKKIGTDKKGRVVLPLGVAVAVDGTVYVSDGQLKRVHIYDATGTFKGILGKQGDFVNPSGIAVDNVRGRIIVVDSQGHTVLVFSKEGERLFSIGERGGLDGMFNFPSYVTIDQQNGNIIVTDTQNFRIQTFDHEGKFLRKFGEVGDAPGSFARPRGIAIDSEGHLYVMDAAFDNMQIFNQDGQILLFVGSAGTQEGYFQTPAGVFIDDEDRIYIADTLNARVQVFQYLSEKWKKEHPEEYSKFILPASSVK